MGRGDTQAPSDSVLKAARLYLGVTGDGWARRVQVPRARRPCRSALPFHLRPAGIDSPDPTAQETQ